MRHVVGVLSVVATVLTAAGLVAQARPNFAGEWKQMMARGQGEPGVDLTITQNATAITLSYRDGKKLAYKLDGSEKATWVGNTMVVVATTSAGDEKRTISMEGGYLVIEVSTPTPNGGMPRIAKVAYQPYERGFGG